MLLSAALLATTLAATPAPRDWAPAETILHIPSPEAARPLFDWFDRAGRRALLLRPESWRDQFHPLLFVNPASPESLEKAGLSPRQAMTVSSDPRTRVACTGISDVERFREQVGKALAIAGEVESKPSKKVEVALARREGKVVAGYALAGGVACAFRAPAGTRSLGDDVVALVTRKPKAEPRFASLEGKAFLWSREGAAGLDAEGSTLILDAQTKRLPASAMLGGGTTPYASSDGSALLHLRMRLPKSASGAMVEGLEYTLREVCTGCDRAALSKAAAQIAPLLTGDALAHATDVKVKASLRDPVARYLSVRHALLAETSAPKKVASVLAGLATQKGASRTEEGVSLALAGGQVLLGVRGNQVYIANDAKALAQAFDSVVSAPQQERLAHGTVFRLNPKALSQGLRQISLLDAIRGGGEAKILGVLFAVSNEAGLLLKASESIDGWIDPVKGGGHHLRLRWTLDAP